MYLKSMSQTIKKFEVNQTKIKGGCQSERKAAEMISYRKMPLGNLFGRIVPSK